MSKTQRECAGRSGHRVSGSALAAESPRSAKRSRREEAEFSPHPDEAGGQIGSKIVWGASAVMRALRECVEHAAASDCTVLLTGETGTGKGEVARLIHRLSPRAQGRLIHVDCAALSPQVIESELFGHERGAFTDAATRHPGRFELAEGGTVFLDEVAELAPNLQAKLLRVLHDRRFERVGGSVTLAMRARVVAATNRPLGVEVASGRFRADLYYRLAVLELELPPLRDRIEDLPELIEEIRRGLSARLDRVVKPPTWAAREILARHCWPGNVRELVNLLERVAICWPGRTFDRRVALQGLGSKGGGGASSPAEDLFDPATLSRALDECRGNVSRAARALGIPRSTLRYRLSRRAPPRAEAVKDASALAGTAWQLPLPLPERSEAGPRRTRR
jgi:DNA-binding NtrC family response regulator